MTNSFGGLKILHSSVVAAIAVACCPALSIARDGAGKTEARQEQNQAASDAASQDNSGNQQITAEVTVADKDDLPPALNVQHINGRDRVSFLNTSFAAADAPYTSSWYDNHPNAWKSADVVGDAWASAPLKSTLDWLGIADAPPANDDNKENADKDDDDKNNNEESSTANKEMDDDEPSTSDIEAAKELAHSTVQLSPDAKFLALGVFALAPEDQDNATAMLQLSVTKEGVLRGTYYDLVSDAAHTIQGALDKESERVAFTIGKDGTTIFETKLADLTNPEGEVSVHFADGEASDWTIGRFETLGSAGSNQK